MPRGWSGSMAATGGSSRTYGLHREFTRSGGRYGRARITRETLRRMAGYFRPYWKGWIVILACVWLAAILNVLPPLCVAMILDRAIPGKDMALLGLLAGAMVGLAVLSGLVGVLQQTLTARTGQNIIFDLRTQLFGHLQRMSLRFFTVNRSGEIVSRVNNDVNAVQNVTTGTLVTIASNVATLTATSVAMLSMNWKLTLLAIAVVPAFYFPSRIVGNIRRRLSASTQETQGRLLAFLQERLHAGGNLLTSIYGQREPDAREFAETSGLMRDLRIRQAVVGRWLFMILGVFSAAGPALVYWYGGVQVIQEQLTPGLLVAFAALLTQLYRPLVQLATVYVDIQGSVAVFERIFEYLDLHPDVQDRPEARTLPEVHGEIRFEKVGFAYPAPGSAKKPSETPDDNGQEESDAPQESFRRGALHEVDLHIEAGQRVALVGPSGAGKTTLTYLVPRFYDPVAGKIFIDGLDLREVQQEELRRHIGMVTQETFLFHATIRENLLYAKTGASEAELLHACRAAHIHEFISGLPDGYDTVVGERGFRLSGGEKQRLSIARALLKDPAILILDEATSSLDATSEHLIQQALDVLLRGRTSLIIAHRLSTILNADQIVVLDHGQVVARGTHRELLEAGGLYAQLFHQQFGRVVREEQDLRRAGNGGPTPNTGRVSQ